MNSTIKSLIEEIKRSPIENGGHLYHPIPFSEFSHLSTSSNFLAVKEKWDKILVTTEQIFNKQLNVLKIIDIGANAGYYTFNFAKLGAKVTAFEPHPRYCKIGSLVAKEKKMEVDWFGHSFEPDIQLPEKKYDICLMLSVYQWMAKGGKTMNYATRCLRRLSEISNYMFFELGFNKGKSCLKTKKLNHYACLIKHLSKNTCYNKFYLIGKTKLWGTSSRYLVLCSNDSRFDDNPIMKLLRRINI